MTNVNVTLFRMAFFLSGNEYLALGELDKVLEYNNLKMTDLLTAIGGPCEKMLIKCRWEGRFESCGQLFRQSLVSGSVCCSFNYEDTLTGLVKKKWYTYCYIITKYIEFLHQGSTKNSKLWHAEWWNFGCTENFPGIQLPSNRPRKLFTSKYLYLTEGNKCYSYTILTCSV